MSKRKKSLRDRVVGLRRVKASEIRPHPNNWRSHPERQREVLRDSLAELGFADVVLARELPDGSLELIDGHLRREEAGDEEIPVVVLDLTASEAKKLLALLDPLAAMADTDPTRLDELIREIQTSSQPIASLIESLAVQAGLLPPDDAGEPAAPTPRPPGPREPQGPQGELFQATIIFEAESQRDAWWALVRHLKDAYPDLDTVGARVARHAADVMGLET